MMDLITSSTKIYRKHLDIFKKNLEDYFELWSHIRIDFELINDKIVLIGPSSVDDTMYFGIHLAHTIAQLGLSHKTYHQRKKFKDSYGFMFLVKDLSILMIIVKKLTEDYPIVLFKKDLIKFLDLLTHNELLSKEDYIKYINLGTDSPDEEDFVRSIMGHFPKLGMYCCYKYSKQREIIKHDENKRINMLGLLYHVQENSTKSFVVISNLIAELKKDEKDKKDEKEK